MTLSQCNFDNIKVCQEKKYLHFLTHCQIFKQNSHCGGDPSVIEHIEPLIFGDVAIVVFVCRQKIFSQLREYYQVLVDKYFSIKQTVKILPLIFFLVPPFVRLLPSSQVYTFFYFYFADV